jgi:hypothetical protein
MKKNHTSQKAPVKEENLIDPAEIQKNYSRISAAANEVLSLLGPGFTHTPEGHVETDIAAAASLAGLSILRSKGLDLTAFKHGSVLLMDLDTEMNDIWNFMMAAAGNMGLDPSGGWDTIIPDANKPLFSIPVMTHTTEKDFISICSRHHLKKDFFPYVAVLASLKLVYAANTMKVLDQNTGKALTGYHVVAASKTVPCP